MPDREMRIRVYKDGRIVVMIFAPKIDARMISSHVYKEGWKYVLQLIVRATKEWGELKSVIRVRHQGLTEDFLTRDMED